MIGDLAVGLKGLLPQYALGCVRNDKVYLLSQRTLETDPHDFSSYYEITKEADGGFAVTYGPAKNGDKDIPDYTFSRCDNVLKYSPQTIFYPINSINGFTDRRSFLIDLINKGYE